VRVQKKITVSYTKAIDARRQATRLLEQAKKAVEDAIAGEAGGEGR
jgi:exonuclease VII small subunit